MSGSRVVPRALRPARRRPPSSSRGRGSRPETGRRRRGRKRAAHWPGRPGECRARPPRAGAPRRAGRVRGRAGGAARRARRSAGALELAQERYVAGRRPVVHDYDSANAFRRRLFGERQQHELQEPSRRIVDNDEGDAHVAVERLGAAREVDGTGEVVATEHPGLVAAHRGVTAQRVDRVTGRDFSRRRAISAPAVRTDVR